MNWLKNNWDRIVSIFFILFIVAFLIYTTIVGEVTVVDYAPFGVGQAK